MSMDPRRSTADRLAKRVKVAQEEERSKEPWPKRSRGVKASQSIKDYKTEIAQLEREIAEMEQTLLQRNENTNEQDTMERIMAHLLHSSSASASTEDSGDVTKHQLKTLASLTGISFSNISSKVQQDNKRSYQLAGDCFHEPFTLQMSVSETDNTVVSLKITVPDEMKTEMQEFLNRVQSSCSPHAFFRGFSQYAELNSKRQNLFLSLKEQFPDHVALPLGSSGSKLLSMSSLSNKLSMTFICEIILSDDGDAIMQAALITKASPSLTAKDKKEDNILPALTRRFATLVKVKGIEAASRIVLSILSGHGVS